MYTLEVEDGKWYTLRRTAVGFTPKPVNMVVYIIYWLSKSFLLLVSPFLVQKNKETGNS